MQSLHFASYDRPLILTYKYSQLSFAANSTIQIAVPRYPAGASIAGNAAAGAGAGRGFGGRVLGGMISRVTTDFVGSTSDAGVRVGDGSDDDKYFDSGLVIDETVDAGEAMYLVNDNVQVPVDIEAGRSAITVTIVGNVGSPAGVADLDLWIAWWQGRTV